MYRRQIQNTNKDMGYGYIYRIHAYPYRIQI